MTKRKLSPQAQVRKDIDKEVQEVIDVAQRMIDDGVPVVLAFKLAFSWFLEVLYYRMRSTLGTDN